MRKHITMSMLCMLTLLSCSQKEEEPERELPERTVLVYMAADNNLYGSARADIEEMLLAATPANGHLVVYLDAPAWSEDTCPQLFSIRQGKATPVKQYGRHNSASGEVLQSVIGDAMSMFPARSYGLVLWSHGTGWLPEGVYSDLPRSASPAAARPQSFGRDGGSEIDVAALAEAMPVKFEFIIFDACLMGSVEVLYQLRGKANTIVASPTETLVVGFPYDEVIPCLFTSPVYLARWLRPGGAVVHELLQAQVGRRAVCHQCRC